MPRLGDMGKGKVSVGENLKEDDTLLRYMSYPQFKGLFRNGLNLTKAAIYAQDDPFEGEFIELVYQIAKQYEIFSEDDDGKRTQQADSLREESRRVREKSYVSCWTLGESENVALWKIYGKDKNSIALKTTIGKLKQAIESFLMTSKESDAGLMKLLKKQIVKVKYIDHRSEDQNIGRKFFNIKAPKILHYKNIAYKYEEEVRVIFDCVESGYGDPPAGEICPLRISPQIFVTEIIVSPFADEWFKTLVHHEMKNYKMAELVNWSNLNIIFNPGAYANSQISEDKKP